MSNERKNAPVWVRMETHQKVKAVAKVRRWKLNEAIDAVFDEYLQRHRIDPRQQKHPAAQTLHSSTGIINRKFLQKR